MTISCTLKFFIIGEFMLIVFIRSLILYLLIVIIMRIMGKRQVGQLQPTELVVSLIIADLAAVPMGDIGIPLIAGIIPILTLFICEEVLSYISMKSINARKIISGKPSIIIQKGIIVESELKRLRYNINDLLEQLRIKDYFSIDEIEYAILETSGELSVIPKSYILPLTKEDLNIKVKQQDIPITLIIDGVILIENLKLINKNIPWLENKLKEHKILHKKDIFFAYINTDNEIHFQMKMQSNRR